MKRGRSITLSQRIGLNIRYYRTARGISGRKFCRLTGISQWSLHRLERGMSDFHISTIEIAALSLGIPIHKLFREVK